MSTAVHDRVDNSPVRVSGRRLAEHVGITYRRMHHLTTLGLFAPVGQGHRQAFGQDIADRLTVAVALCDVACCVGRSALPELARACLDGAAPLPFGWAIARVELGMFHVEHCPSIGELASSLVLHDGGIVAAYECRPLEGDHDQ